MKSISIEVLEAFLKYGPFLINHLDLAGGIYEIQLARSENERLEARGPTIEEAFKNIVKQLSQRAETQISELKEIQETISKVLKEIDVD